MDPEEEYEDGYLDRKPRPGWRVIAAILIVGLLGLYVGSYLTNLLD